VANVFPLGIRQSTNLYQETHSLSVNVQRKKQLLLVASYGMVQRERGTSIIGRSHFIATVIVHTFHHYATVALWTSVRT
jgi:hypothetical protein